MFGGVGGALSGINWRPINFRVTATSGFDLQGNYTMDFWDGQIALVRHGQLYRRDHPHPARLTHRRLCRRDGRGRSAADRRARRNGRACCRRTYTTGPYSFTVQARWYGTGILNNAWNGGNLVTAATREHRQQPGVQCRSRRAYLDLRASYKWNDNIQFYGAVDNATDVPPPLVPSYSGGIQAKGGPSHTSSQYDLLGRTFRLGVRFNY